MCVWLVCVISMCSSKRQKESFSINNHILVYPSVPSVPSVPIVPSVPLTKSYSNYKSALSAWNNVTVPKLIFRTGPFKLHNMPEEVKGYLDDVVLKNPEYTQVYFDDLDCENFIREFFPEYIEDYRSLIPTAFKADLWRLLVIYKYGGIYSDIGHIFVEPINKIISNTDQLVFCVDSVPEFIHNAFFASSTKNPVIKTLIDCTINNIRQRNYGEDPLDITGPMAWGRCIRKLFRMPLASAFSPGIHTYRDQYSNNYTVRFVKYFAYIWKDPRNCILNIENKKVIVTKFPNYYNIMYTDRNVKHYGELWRLRQVFT